MDGVFTASYVLNIAVYIVWGSLFLASAIALAVIIDRFIFFTRTSTLDHNFVDSVLPLIKDGGLSAAIAVSEASKSPLAGVIVAGLKNPKNPSEYMLAQSNKELPKIERFIATLSTISTVSPLLGLLGTVLGMIESFGVISVVGSGQPSALANGIANALLTTAAGLIIAIPSVVAYNHFVQRLNNRIAFMENISNEIADLISKP